MYYDGKKADDDVSIMQACLRQQAARLNQPMDWFFDQPELRDDGDHPLLDDYNEPRYSREVMRQAFATWVNLDNTNPFKFICNYYHVLEKMGDENAPPHVQKYVKESLEREGMSECKEAPDHLAHQSLIDSPLHISQLHRPTLFRHFHSDNSYLRTYGEAQPAAFNDGSKWIPYDMYSYGKQFCKEAKCSEHELYAGEMKVGEVRKIWSEEKQYRHRDPFSQYTWRKTESLAETTAPYLGMNDAMCNMKPVDSPSKASVDSCYQSMSSPTTDHEED